MSKQNKNNLIEYPFKHEVIIWAESGRFSALTSGDLDAAKQIVNDLCKTVAKDWNKAQIYEANNRFSILFDISR
jgi:hypothetical protein